MQKSYAEMQISKMKIIQEKSDNEKCEKKMIENIRTHQLKNLI